MLWFVRKTTARLGCIEQNVTTEVNIRSLPMAQDKKCTTDHDEIKHWVEEHDGRPALLKEETSSVTPIKIIFPEYDINDHVEEVTWTEWFREFEEEDLAFEYKEDVEEGEEVGAFKLIHR
jgi:hypothetical protein